MANVAPDSTIKVCRNVPLDNTYNHTILFSSTTTQYNYFNGLAKRTFDDYLVVRGDRMSVKVGAILSALIDCNYIMYRNTDFGNKWFYAFITSLNYVNNETTEIEFELDVLQTWHFDYNRRYCYVERQHTETDEVGDNLVPEPVSVGEYVYNGGYGPIYDGLESLCVLVLISDVSTVSGTLYDGIYGAGTLYAFKRTDYSAINKKLQDYANKPDSVLGIYMCPTWLVVGVSGEIPSGGTTVSYNATGRTIQVSKTRSGGNGSLDGYTPKNKKMYSYPFNFYNVDNGNGSSLQLRYECFKNRQPSFLITGSITQPVEMVLLPTNYKNIPDFDEYGVRTLNSECLTITSYPMCSWSYDSFKNWIATQAMPQIVSSGANIASGAVAGTLVGGGAGAVGGAVVGLASAIGNLASQAYIASIQGDVCKGNFGNGGALTAKGISTFWGGRMSVMKHVARQIDDFFTVFGYAVNRMKIPAIDNRPHWNYVKTNGMVITGSVPAQDEKKICSIYDNGVTFWKNGSEVGNYSLDNSP